MQLFKENIEIDIVVLAENKQQAKELIKKHLVEEIEELDESDFFPKKIEKMDNLPIGWEDLIPYGCENNKNCSTLLEENEDSSEK